MKRNFVVSLVVLLLVSVFSMSVTAQGKTLTIASGTEI